MKTSTRRYALPILANSLDVRQVELDVTRCTWHLLTGDQRIQTLQMEHKRNRKVARLIRRKQRRLANLINYTLVRSYPLTSPQKMRYYQGYHDVACIFLSVLGGGNGQRENVGGIPQDMEELAAAMGLELPSKVLLQVSQSHLRDFLKSDFTELQTAMELTIFPLMAKLDPEIYNFLLVSGMQPFFALSWVITWFSHEVRDTETVKRLYDVFIVSHPLMPIYLSVAMVLHPVNRQIVLASEHDFGTVHQALRDLTKNSSMTGWKYRPGDGYVSDDGEDEDHDDEDDEALEQAGIDGDMARIKSELLVDNKDYPQTASSSVSTGGDSLSEGQSRVTFQELIDLALDIMRRVPPRKLLPLAVRCYSGPHVAALLARSPNIRLFADPPTWAVRSTAISDWVVHHRMQKRAEHSNVENFTKQQMYDSGDSEVLKVVLLKRRHSAAVIALGFGEGDEKLRRKRRNRMIVASVSVAILAIAVGLAMNTSLSPSKEGAAAGTDKTESSSRVLVASTAPEASSLAIENIGVAAAKYLSTASAYQKEFSSLVNDASPLAKGEATSITEQSSSTCSIVEQNVVSPEDLRDSLKQHPPAKNVHSKIPMKMTGGGRRFGGKVASWLSTAFQMQRNRQEL